MDEIDEFQNINDLDSGSDNETIIHYDKNNEDDLSKMKDELANYKEIVNTIKDTPKDMMTSEEFKGKRILELSKQIRSLNRKIAMEADHQKKLERLVKVNNLDKEEDPAIARGIFNTDTPLDNEIVFLKNKHKKLTSEVSLMRMEYQSFKSIYHKLIRVCNSSFEHCLKHEDKFKKEKKSINLVNEKNFETAIDFLSHEDYGFKGTGEYIEEYNVELKQAQKEYLKLNSNTMSFDNTRTSFKSDNSKISKNSMKSSINDKQNTNKFNPKMDIIDEESEQVDEKSLLKKQITEMNSIIDFKEGEIKSYTKKYHQQIARKRSLELEIAECTKQLSFLLDNEHKLMTILTTQKQAILNLDRKRKGEHNILMESDLYEQKADLEDKIAVLEQENDQLKNQKKKKNTKMDRTVQELIKENNDLKKKLNELKNKL